MQLHLNFSNNENATFLVKSNNQEFVIKPFTTQISIDLVHDEAQEIKIIQQCRNKRTILSWIGWFLTLPLQGLFSAIMTYGDEVWYKQVNPYLMVASFLIIPTDNSNIDISFADRKHRQWLCTIIECAQAKDIILDYLPNPEAIYVSYVGYVKKVISVSFIGISLFVLLLFEMISINNATGILTCVMLIVFFGVLDALLIITQYFKAKKLHDTFIGMVDGFA